MGHGKLEIPLESQSELETIADRLLKKSGVYGTLPTPLDALSNDAGLSVINDLPEKESFLKTLPESGKKIFVSALKSLRGIADLREKTIYIPKGQSNTKERFAHAHEIAHQSIEWHNLGDPYMDTQYDFKPSMKKIVEREANYLGAELLYQGDRFRQIALDYSAGMNAALILADQHHTSKHATLIKYTQIQDERTCLMEYYPHQNGNPSMGFRFYKASGSPKFEKKFGDIELPQTIEGGHDWCSATSANGVSEGTIQLRIDGQYRNFEWSAWFNTYTLFVMLRDRPKLHQIGGIIRASKKTLITRPSIFGG